MKKSPSPTRSARRRSWAAQIVPSVSESHEPRPLPWDCDPDTRGITRTVAPDTHHTTDTPTPPRVFREPAALSVFEDPWRDLVAATPGGSYFATPDWVLAYWETLLEKEASRAETAVWTDPDGRVGAVVPLHRTRGRLHPRVPVPVTHRTLLGSGEDAADHGVFPVAPHRRADVAFWLSHAVRGTLWLPAADPEADTGLLPARARRIARTTCPRLEIGPETPVGSTSFRALMRRRARQLAAEGVTFRWVPPAEMTPDVLDTVLRLHLVRRREQGGPTAFGPHRAAFHHRLTHRAAADRGPAAMLAECAGTPVAAIYGFLWQDTFAYYNGGWDPAFARLSLGTAAMDRTIAAVAAMGVRTFDFLRGAETYKFHPFGAHDRHDEQWLRPTGISARVAGAVVRVGARKRASAAESRADAATAPPDTRD